MLWSVAFISRPRRAITLQAVMAELKIFDLEHVMPMHCNGQNSSQDTRHMLPLSSRAVKATTPLGVHLLIRDSAALASVPMAAMGQPHSGP